MLWGGQSAHQRQGKQNEAAGGMRKTSNTGGRTANNGNICKYL
jgi:hypothetical protein